MLMYFERTKHDDLAEPAQRPIAQSARSTGSSRVGLLHPLPDTWMTSLLSVLRIVTGFLFMAHGTQKLFAFPTDAGRAPVDLASLMGVAGVIEFVGGALLLVGLLTRPVAFLLSGEMATAYFMQHAPEGFWPALNGGELAALYCFLFLFFAAAGPGPWSLDARIRRAMPVGHHDPTPHARWRTSP
jgi:putative oxidoreductase